MRLMSNEKDCIVKAVRKNFTAVSAVLLFGSRTDDTKRGGDIDVLVETDEAQIFAKKIQTITDIQLKLGEQKIDIVVTSGHGDERLIVQNAYREGIFLWKNKIQQALSV